MGTILETILAPKSNPKQDHKRNPFLKHVCYRKYPPKKKQKTHRHESMQKTNIPSEVLILLKHVEKPHFVGSSKWTPKWSRIGVISGSISGHLWDRFLTSFWLPFGSILAPFCLHFESQVGSGRAKTALGEAARASKAAKRCLSRKLKKLAVF